MGRAIGANAKVIAVFESVVGTVPNSAAAWGKIPLASHSLGEERPLITSDIIGLGREMQDPTDDVATNDGDIVVPVDVRNFGKWLKLFFGAATSTGTTGDYEHVFVSGAAALPSMSIEIGAPEVPSYSVQRGARGNQLKIGMSRSGLLNASCSLVCIGETDPVTATVGSVSPTEMAVRRFPQAAGYVKKDGSALGSVIAADFTYSNDLEKVETIQEDGRIEDSDPGSSLMSGSVTVRFKDNALLTAATSRTPIDLTFGWAVDDFSLMFHVPRVFLPRPKRPITGPRGIQAVFNWQASGALGNAVTVTLANDVAAY
jgi:hypothetical protein